MQILVRPCLSMFIHSDKRPLITTIVFSHATNFQFISKRHQLASNDTLSNPANFTPPMWASLFHAIRCKAEGINC